MAGTLGKTKGKAHLQGGILYDTWVKFDFTTTANVAAPSINTLQQFVVLPLAFKCFGVYVTCFNATIPTSTFAVNIVNGTGNPAGTVAPNDNSETQGYPATVATANQQFWASNQDLTGVTTKVPLLLATPDNPDAIYAGGTVLSIRYAGTGTLTATAGLPVVITIFGKFYDNSPTHGQSSNLNPQTDF